MSGKKLNLGWKQSEQSMPVYVTKTTNYRYDVYYMILMIIGALFIGGLAI